MDYITASSVIHPQLLVWSGNETSTRGRPKKASAVQETPHRLNPERRATCTSRFSAEPASELDTMNEGTSNYASSQVHICQVLKLIDCDEHENSVRPCQYENGKASLVPRPRFPTAAGGLHHRYVESGSGK